MWQSDNVKLPIPCSSHSLIAAANESEASAERWWTGGGGGLYAHLITRHKRMEFREALREKEEARKKTRLSEMSLFDQRHSK